MRWWLALLALVGCFRSSSSGEPDGSVRRDGGGECSIGGTVVSLTCPSDVREGETASVGFQVRGACCTTSTESLVALGGDQLVISRTTTYCDCPSGVTPSCGQDESVDLPPLTAGSYTVSLEGQTCTFEVLGDDCRPMRVDELRAPRAVFAGEPLAFSALTHDPGTCSCEPALGSGGPWSPDLCHCCDECDCIDRGYEVGFVGPAASGALVVGDQTRPFSVHSLDECGAVEPTGLRIVAPELDYRSDGPRLYWAVVSAAPQVCCAEPFGAVRELEVGAAGTTLELRTCHVDPCPCIGPNTPFEAWHALGELAPGGHFFRAGTHEVAFTVEADGSVTPR